jgi:hypothetical protein
MFRLLMAPSNTVCDALKITDEHERGMMRMLINMLIFTALVVPVFFVAWKLIGGGWAGRAFSSEHAPRPRGGQCSPRPHGEAAALIQCRRQATRSAMGSKGGMGSAVARQSFQAPIPAAPSAAAS